MAKCIFYSFRRCPYAIRARMALAYAQMPVQLREVILKNKPDSMLQYSPKGTVPVLVLADGSVLDESLEIMMWVLAQNDPDAWLIRDPELESLANDLVAKNDGEFKHYLDRYKYSVGYPEHSAEFYRENAQRFLALLEARLVGSQYLLGEAMSFVDVAIFPFVRQFAFVDKGWFDQAPYPHVQKWLDRFLVSELFLKIMTKFSPWQEGDEPILFP